MTRITAINPEAQVLVLPTVGNFRHRDSSECLAMNKSMIMKSEEEIIECMLCETYTIKQTPKNIEILIAHDLSMAGFCWHSGSACVSHL